MWKNSEVHFAEDYFFKEHAFGTDALVSDALELGVTEGGIRVHGWIDGSASCASGNTVKVELEVANEPNASEWRKIAENTVTADATSMSGDIFSFIPDVEDHFMRVKVSGASGVTGTFSIAPELVP